MTRITFAAIALALAGPAVADNSCKLRSPPWSGTTTFASGTIGTRITGSGNIVEQPRNASGFAAVRVKGPFSIDARPAERESVTVRIDDNLQTMVETEVMRDGTLEVRAPRNAGFTTRSQPTVIVEYVKLNVVTIDGSGDVIANNLRPVESFRAAVSGSGDVCLTGVRAARLELAVSGSGDVRAAGGADQLAIKISGSGDVDARELTGVNVKVSIAGSGNAKVNAMDSLDVSIAGSGDVRYAGKAKVSKSIAGSGTVKPL
jgi:hypothetical protein